MHIASSQAGCEARRELARRGHAGRTFVGHTGGHTLYFLSLEVALL